MTKFSFLTSIILTGLSLYSQIDIKLSTIKQQYLQYEEVYVKINLTNNSGKVIKFGDKDGELNLELRNYNNSVINSNKDSSINLAKNLILKPGTTQTLEIQINQFYDISSINRYSIYAKIKHKFFDGFSLKSVTPAIFKVTNGAVELKKNFGVSSKKGDKESIQSRVYYIISYLRDNKRYMSLKIDDEKFVYAINEIGVFVRGVPIQHKVDAFSNIHLVFHIGAKTFKYVVFSSSGEEKQRRYLLATDEAYPLLQLDKDTGGISILNDTPATEGINYQLN